MKSKVYWIEMTPPGRLGIASRPRGGDWLAGDLLDWKSAGIAVVVSALEKREQVELELEHEEQEAAAAGLQFIGIPIPDRGVPADRIEFITQIVHVFNLLSLDSAVLIHCRQGIGRSSLISACLLTLREVAPTKALRLIHAARGIPVPETDEQKQWIEAFAKRPSRRR